MGMFPEITNSLFTEGTIITSMEKCKEHFCVGSCQKFYNNISTKSDGFYKCPSGYTVYKRTKSNQITYYCGFRVKKYCDKISIKNSESNTVLNADIFLRLLTKDDELKMVAEELRREKSVNKELLHDIRKLDGLVKNKAEEVVEQYSLVDDDTIYEIVQKVHNIKAMEDLIACKYAIYDLVSNIEMLSIGKKISVPVYKKFDKARYILMNSKDQRNTITFRGETEFKYNVNLMYFELLPFLLLENAVKYSYNNHEIEVVFQETSGGLNVLIKSFSPYCPKEEIAHICENSYRGDIAKKVVKDGMGIGLYLVKKICDQHGIELTITSEYQKKVNGVPFGSFTVQLEF